MTQIPWNINPQREKITRYYFDGFVGEKNSHYNKKIKSKKLKKLNKLEEYFTSRTAKNSKREYIKIYF